MPANTSLVTRRVVSLIGTGIGCVHRSQSSTVPSVRSSIIISYDFGRIEALPNLAKHLNSRIITFSTFCCNVLGHITLEIHFKINLQQTYVIQIYEFHLQFKLQDTNHRILVPSELAFIRYSGRSSKLISSVNHRTSENKRVPERLVILF